MVQIRPLDFVFKIQDSTIAVLLKYDPQILDTKLNRKVIDLLGKKSDKFLRHFQNFTTSHIHSWLNPNKY